MTTDLPAAAGPLLRHWRQRRRLSQLDLALATDTSTRHLSFVETGKAQASRALLLKLSEALDVPLRDRNEILLGGGFAPMYTDASTDPAARRALSQMLDAILAAYEPWPAVVLDPGLDVVASNSAFAALTALLDPSLLEPPVNVVRATLHPRGLAPHIVNLAAWRDHLLRQLRQNAQQSGRADLTSLLDECLGYPSARATDSAPRSGPTTYALPLELRVGDEELRFISTIATFGSPLEVVASELAIETFLPADDRTRSWLASG